MSAPPETMVRAGAGYRVTIAVGAVGFGLGGFFDGILLHQVLQWHHLLSGVDALAGDLPRQILADGLFHLLMYVVTAMGLWLLWQQRRELGAPGSGRSVATGALVGFGTWHVADAVLSHWLLGIHRIRMDTDNPLLWDLLWLAGFGLVPLLLGVRNWQARSARGTLACPPVALAVAAILAGAVALQSPPGADATVVLFRPDVSAEAAFAAMRALGGRLLWTDPTSQVWAMEFSEGTNPLELYRRGALLVSAASPAGCLAWSEA